MHLRSEFRAATENVHFICVSAQLPVEWCFAPQIADRAIFSVERQCNETFALIAVAFQRLPLTSRNEMFAAIQLIILFVFSAYNRGRNFKVNTAHTSGSAPKIANRNRFNLFHLLSNPEIEHFLYIFLTMSEPITLLERRPNELSERLASVGAPWCYIYTNS